MSLFEYELRCYIRNRKTQSKSFHDNSFEIDDEKDVLKFVLQYLERLRADPSKDILGAGFRKDEYPSWTEVLGEDSLEDAIQKYGSP